MKGSTNGIALPFSAATRTHSMIMTPMLQPFVSLQREKGKAAMPCPNCADTYRNMHRFISQHVPIHIGTRIDIPQHASTYIKKIVDDHLHMSISPSTPHRISSVSISATENTLREIPMTRLDIPYTRVVHPGERIGISRETCPMSRNTHADVPWHVDMTGKRLSGLSRNRLRDYPAK